MKNRALVAGPILLALLWPSPSEGAPSPGWKPYGLQGLEVQSLAATPDLLCAGTAADGVFCRDLGTASSTWRPLGPMIGVASWLWIDPSAPTHMFAATGGNPGAFVLLYRSLNGGATWQPAETGLSTSVYAVHGVPGTSTLYAVGDAIWRSVNLGSSWQQIHSPIALGRSLEVSPTDPATVWAGGETFIMAGYTLLSRNGGATWTQVWNSLGGPGPSGDNRTDDISAHPTLDGVVLTGHEGFVLRSENYGGAFTLVLTAPTKFFLDWDRVNTSRAYAAGAFDVGYAFVSRDTGVTWSDITGVLASRSINRLEADDKRLGVAYAATDDGVYRFYGGGLPSCLDSSGGVDDLMILPGPCPPGPPPATPLVGDVIAGDLGSITQVPGQIDLGEVECLASGVDITHLDIDPPEPPPGRALFFLARPAGAPDYGSSSSGLPRRAGPGDCGS